MENNAYVTLSGTVAYISNGDEFGLDYGGGVIKIDTNDAWPNLFKRETYSAASMLAEGDSVWVSGKIDDNWFNEKELDAYTLQQEESGRIVMYKPPGTILEEPADRSVLPEKGAAIITGTIGKVVSPHVYLLQYGTTAASTIQVDVSRIGGIGPNAYEVGDRVKVSGSMNDRLFMRREIDATQIAPVAKARGGMRG